MLRPSVHRSALTLAALLAVAVAGAAPRALLVIDQTNPEVGVATANLRALLLGRGFTVDESGFVPLDLNPYCCVWDLRPFSPLDPTEMARYLSFLQAGHGLMLMGENVGCCGFRDDSIADFVNGFAGGGPVAVPTQRPGTYVELGDPFHPVTTTPNSVKQVTYDGVAGGTWSPVGSGDVLTQDAGLSLTALGWVEGSLAAAPSGRLVSVLDLNWMVDTWFATDNIDFADNISHFLCPTTSASFAVQITTPTPIVVECPAGVTLEGIVVGSGLDCVQQTTPLAPLALGPPPPPAPRVPGVKGDEPRLAARTADPAEALAATPPPGAASTAPVPGLLGGIVQAVEVSVNGGPFTPVTSTSPALPSATPVAFTAAGLPLVLGLNTVVVRATDDLGDQASAAVTVEQKDTQPPDIDPLTCQPVTLDLDAACSASFFGIPDAFDLCDPAITITSTPPIPLLFSAPGTQTVSHTASDDSGNSSSCSRPVTARDVTAPALACAPPQTVECTATGGTPRTDPQVQAWLAATTASDNCALASLADDAPATFPSACPPGQPTTVTFTATDASTNTASCSSVLRVQDSKPPALTQVPAPLTLECSAPGGVPAASPAVVAWLATFSAQDVCAPGATKTNDVPALLPSGCAPGKTTTVTFTAADGCSNSASATSTATVVDTTPPALAVPGPLVLECNGPGGVAKSDPAIQAWLALATASDVCGAATVANDAPAVFPSGCGAGQTTIVTFTATDACGNAVQKSAALTVRDTTAPALVVPPPLVLECNSPGGVPLSDPQVQAWLALATATDVCDGATITHDAPALFPSGCDPGTTTVVTFRAADDCGNVATLTSSVTVRDTTPPVVGPAAFDGLCLWPPNHDFYCIDDVVGSIEASDVCDPAVRLEVAGCVSSQPEDAEGDGRFAPDCVISADRRGVCVRSERQGGVPEGRTYTITVTASDGCNNSTGREARIHVPHDQSPRAACARPNRGKHLPAR